MKSSIDKILLALTILFPLVLIVVLIGGLSNWFSLGRFWGNVAFHFPILTFLFWQLYASRTGKTKAKRRLPLLICAGGFASGIALMFLLSFIPLLGFMILVLSAMFLSGSLAGLILHPLVRRIFPE